MQMGSAVREQLVTQGFMIVPGVLSEDAADNLADYIQAVLEREQGGRTYAMRHLMESVPVTRELANSPAIRELVEPVIGQDAVVVKSLFFDKTADKNWKVAWHQDLTIAVREKIETPGFSGWSVKEGVTHVQPPVSVLEGMIAVRLHLDDCGATNGPLQVIPDSHKLGRLEAGQIAEWRKRTCVTCLVPRGGALLMRPLLLHASSRATEPKHRRVIHLEFASRPLPGGLRWP